jgi:hypothetical protein
MPVPMLPQRPIDDGRLKELAEILRPSPLVERYRPRDASFASVVPVPRRDPSFTFLDQVARALDVAYSIRSCFVCGKLKRCEHRQPEAELAAMEGMKLTGTDIRKAPDGE